MVLIENRQVLQELVEEAFALSDKNVFRGYVDFHDFRIDDIVLLFLDRGGMTEGRDYER